MGSFIREREDKGECGDTGELSPVAPADATEKPGQEIGFRGRVLRASAHPADASNFGQ
jgi:hypothetical protein